MRVIEGDRTIIEVRVRAEPAADEITEDYYARLPQIRLTADPTSRQKLPRTAVQVTLDDTDIARLVECAVGHPSANMRSSALAPIWRHPESFRRILQFGLNAPDAFSEIRKIVAEELDRYATPATAVKRGPPAAESLLPKMPLPPHLRDRERRE
jgi:hypothetical protein